MAVELVQELAHVAVVVALVVAQTQEKMAVERPAAVLREVKEEVVV